MMLRVAAHTLLVLFLRRFDSAEAALRLKLPTSEMPCKIVMKETKDACSAAPYGSSVDACNFAVCYTADLNRERCVDVETDRGHAETFVTELDALKTFHDIDCTSGAQGDSGVRNARFDCGKVEPSGMYKPFLVQFAKDYPASATSSGLSLCFEQQ
eukprot:TRINITY_DN64219_c0_g1_i1.p1 TRINITY_DN64219_c0_g1~~TRINITY_DN64219_c0_g1_i1.p1  ORF type:complete len:156 (+),score=35.96 TRINITY_DN64219_c0_g1_i1:78-545(+)